MALDFGKIGNIQKQHEEELKLEQERKERELREAQEKIEREKYGDIPKDVFEFMLECLSDAIDYAEKTGRGYAIIKEIVPGKSTQNDFAVATIYSIDDSYAYRGFSAKINCNFVITLPGEMQLLHTPSEPGISHNESAMILIKNKQDGLVIWQGYNIWGKLCQQEIVYAKIRYLCYIFNNNKATMKEVFEHGLANKAYTRDELGMVRKIKFT